MLNIALDYFDRSQNYQWKAHSYNAIGDIYIELENFDRAISIYRTALTTLPEEYVGGFDEGLIYSNLANGLFMNGILDSAKYFVQRSIQIYKDEKMDWGMAFSYGILSKIAIKEEQYQEAKEYARSSLVYSTDQGTPAEMAEAYMLMGEACVLNDELDAAFNAVGAGETIATSSNMLPMRVKAKQLYASIFEKKGNSKRSYKYYKEYIALKDSLLGLDKIEELNQVNLKFETAKRDVEIANQDLQIARQKITRNYLLGGIGGLALLSLLFFIRSRFKQKINETQLKLKQEQIENLEQKQKLMAVDYIMKGQEEERRRVAKDLHDSLGGLLSTAKHQLKTFGKSINQSDSEVYKQTENLITSAHAEVRKIAHNMMPDALTNLGLKSAIEDLANQVSLTGKLEVKTQFIMYSDRLTSDQEIVVYRIIQESINNVFKHANAAHLIIQIIDQGNNIHMTIEDDGDGFDMDDNLKKGIGLRSMESRVKYLNGVFEIDSKKGNGTTIDIIIPIQ